MDLTHEDAVPHIAGNVETEADEVLTLQPNTDNIWVLKNIKQDHMLLH